MPQLHCYLPKEIAEKLRHRADAEETSVSALLSALVKREVGVLGDWPRGYFKKVVGGWQGEPLARQPQPGTTERPGMRRTR